MPNTLITTSYLANEGLDILANTCVFSDKVYRKYSDEFAIKDAVIGATVNIPRPPRYVGTFGPGLNVEDTNRTYIPVSLNYQFHVDVQFQTVDLLLSMPEFRPTVLEPVLEAVGNRIDSDGCYFAYQNTGLSVGTPGTSPTSFKTFSDARAILAYEGAPKNRIPDAIMDPLSMSSMSDALKGLFNPQVSISDNYENGIVAKKTAGLDWFEDQNIPTFTLGAQGGTPTLKNPPTGTALLTTGWAQNGTLDTIGWTNSTAVAKVGDVLQVAGVFPVNPQNRGQYGRALKQIVVLPPAGYAPMSGPAAPGGPQFAAATLAAGTFNATTGVYTSSGAGALTLTVGECLISGGQFQNCTVAPANSAAITVNGGTGNAGQVSPQGIVMHRNAFALAFADLPLPRGVHEAARARSKTVNMSLRVVSQYTINNDALPTRVDALYGYSSVYRQQAIRVPG